LPASRSEPPPMVGGPRRPDVQGVLNENAQLLAALKAKAKEGKSQEGSVLQQRLHANLCYLASLATQPGDPGVRGAGGAPPPGGAGD